MLLDTHFQVCAPHEMYLRAPQVTVPRAFVAPRMTALGPRELLVWDRVLHLQLVRSGKDTVVDKLPGNIFVRDLRFLWTPVIQPGRAVPDEPLGSGDLRDVVVAWGYGPR